jgi:hypothetical protein
MVLAFVNVDLATGSTSRNFADFMSCQGVQPKFLTNVTGRFSMCERSLKSVAHIIHVGFRWFSSFELKLHTKTYEKLLEPFWRGSSVWSNKGSLVAVSSRDHI